MQFNGHAKDIWRKIKESKDGSQKIKEISEDPETEIENWKEGIRNEY